MPESIQRERQPRVSRARLLTVAALVSGLVVMGLGARSLNPSRAASRDEALSCGDDPCYSPHQFRAAYGIQPLLDRGIDGRGETVTVLVPVPVPSDEPTDIRQDLAAFDRMFGLPAARLAVVTSLAGSAAPDQANFEEVGDLEIVHAVAPAAALRVVLFPLARTLNATDLLAGLRLAVSDTGVVVIGWVVDEHSFTPPQVSALHTILRGASARHVTVVGSSGKYGAFSTPDSLVKEVSLPASDPLVLAVGGTSLTADPSTGAYRSETAWSGSGGGFSHLYARPSYQDGVPGIAQRRGVPDVAGDSDPVGAMARVDAAGGQGYLESGLVTSPAAALWGGLVALADQDAHHDLGSVNPMLYGIARSASYHRAFHDIKIGSNGYQTAPGWDPVTGWGTPNAQVLVPLLARSTTPRAT